MLEGSRYGVNRVPPQPQNVALFENGVVVDVIVQDGVTAAWGGRLIQYH